MKAYWGEWKYSSTHSLTSALDEGDWSASRPGRFTPMERAPVTHWIGGWVGPRTGLDTVSKRKIHTIVLWCYLHSKLGNVRSPDIFNNTGEKKNLYGGRLKSSWTGGSLPLL
jgi:hypothetical protein